MKTQLFRWLAALAFCASLHQAAAQGTAFTYQGQLQNNGSLAGGNYDFTFALFNTNNTTTGQVGNTLTNLDVDVTNGLFTVSLDFGAVFTGTPCWLAIGVRTNGGSGFTALSPLQALTPTPYAIYSPNSGSAASAGSVAATNISGTILPGQLAGNVLTNGGTNVTLTGAFSGNGGGLTNLAAWQLSGNTGTTNGNFIGTTDNQPLQIRVGGVQAGLFTASNGSQNVVFGTAQNVISNGTAGTSILGGTNNMVGAGSSFSVIGGGQLNVISNTADHSIIVGGNGNGIWAVAYDSAVVGGNANSIQSGDDYSFIGGGNGNSIQAGANMSVLSGGFGNTIQASAYASFIGGGIGNQIVTGASYSVIGGGNQNVISTSAYQSVIGGGNANSIGVGSDHSFIGGGQDNKMLGSANYSVLAGGEDNMIWIGDTYSVIGGGYLNNIQSGAAYSVIGGGNLNTVSSNYDAVGGGSANMATANYATVPGGSNNLAGGQFSFAAGANAQATNSGAFVWSDAEGMPFGSTRSNQFNVRASGGVRLVTGGTGLSVDGQPVYAGPYVLTNNEPNVSLGSLYLDGNLYLEGGALYSFFGQILYSDGSGNTALGQEALVSNTNGVENTACGCLALFLNTTGSGNTASGLEALLNNTTGNNNTANGFQALLGNTTGIENTANGANALMNNTIGYNNAANGCQALYANTVGFHNTAAGGSSLQNNVNGNGNVADGFEALYLHTTGDNNVAVGAGSLQTDGTDAGDTAVGAFALQNLSSGGNNLALGINAGNSLINGANNLYLGNTGNATETGIIRIGTTGTQTACYLAGTVYADGVALTSDRNAKENFQPLDTRSVLAKVAALPVTEWNYRSGDKTVQHIGPMAQDFQAAFQLSADDKHISVVDEGGVALAAIQGLNAKMDEKDAEIEALKQSVTELKQMMQTVVEKK